MFHERRLERTSGPRSPALAFDTDRNAANAVQVENWLTDCYASTPTFGSAAQCDFENVHFDNVFSRSDQKQ